MGFSLNKWNFSMNLTMKHGGQWMFRAMKNWWFKDAFNMF